MKWKNSIWVRGMIVKLNFKDQHEYQQFLEAKVGIHTAKQNKQQTYHL